MNRSFKDWVIRSQFGQYVLHMVHVGEEYPGMWDQVAEYFTAE